MLPGDGLLSTIPVQAEFLAPRDRPYQPTVSYEFGGPALNTPASSRLVRIWAAYHEDGNIWVAPEDGGVAVPLLSITQVDTLSLAFDQNMNPTLAYMSGGVCNLRWFDSVANAMVITSWPGVTSAQVICDDKRDTEVGNSDVIFAYTKDSKLYYRQQRDRYGVEYLLHPHVGGSIKRLGMNVKNRLQFEIG